MVWGLFGVVELKSPVVVVVLQFRKKPQFPFGVFARKKHHDIDARNDMVQIVEDRVGSHQRIDLADARKKQDIHSRSHFPNEFIEILRFDNGQYRFLDIAASLFLFDFQDFFEQSLLFDNRKHDFVQIRLDDLNGRFVFSNSLQENRNMVSHRQFKLRRILIDVERYFIAESLLK